MNAPGLPGCDIRDVESFLIHEARLLDERSFDPWMQLFAQDGYYWAPARPGQTDPWSEVSLIFDDLEIMKNRIQRLKHPKAYAQLPPSRTVRQVSNVSVDSVDPKAMTLGIRSVLFMCEHRPTLPEPLERTFAGHCFHTLRRTEESFRILVKKVMLVNCDSAFDSLHVYF